MSDQSSREIQLTGKQLIFLFMSAIVLLVVVFLLGVSVGRGVGSERLASGSAQGEPVPGDTMVPAGAPAAADDPVELSYPTELTGRGATPPAAPPTPPDEVPPITPPGVARGEVVEDVPQPPPTPPVSSDGWLVQVGAYRSREGADRVVRELTAKGHKAYVLAAGGLNRVRVGPFADRAAADAAAAEIRRMGHNPTVQKEGQ
jgi:DedD protein